MMMAHLVHMQEIRLESLSDGPGLLPYKLGQTRLITHYHSFLQYIQLDDIENKVTTVRDQLSEFEQKLHNDTYAIYELQINYLSHKIDKVLSHLKGLEPCRTKRGLIDGLGSIVKSITGNLDYQDAIKFDNAIKNLNNNQDKIISEFNTHISLSKEWMTQHNDVIDQLVRNQQSINSTLVLLLNSNAYKDNSLLKYAQFAQLLTIITENVDDLLEEIVRIENILALVRALSTHHSMVNIDTLGKMVDRLRIIYGDSRLLSLDLRDYYSIIKPGSYFIGKQIVIVFKIPIVSTDVYDFYKLSIAPNSHNQVLIPPNPFLATNKEAYVYMEAECPKVDKQYLCVGDTIKRVKNQQDCARELVINHALGEACNLTTVALKSEAMEQLDDKDYIMSFPQSTKVHLRCGREEYEQLQGSYLVTVPLNCTVMTSEFTIVNENNEVHGQPLLITGISYNLEPEYTPPHKLTLQSIDLRKLHNAYNQAMMQPNIERDTTAADAFYHTTLPFYVVLLSAFTLALAVMLRKRFNLCRHNIPQQPDDQIPTEHEPEDPENPTAFPAIFSLKVGK